MYVRKINNNALQFLLKYYNFLFFLFLEVAEVERTRDNVCDVFSFIFFCFLIIILFEMHFLLLYFIFIFIFIFNLVNGQTICDSGSFYTTCIINSTKYFNQVCIIYFAFLYIIFYFYLICTYFQKLIILQSTVLAGSSLYIVNGSLLCPSCELTVFYYYYYYHY